MSDSDSQPAGLLEKPSEYVEGYLNSDIAKTDSIAVNRLYVDMTGHLTDGVIFSRIMYWFSKSKKQQKTRASIVRDGYLWIAREYEHWWAECRIDERTARASVARMVKSGLISKAVYKFKGKPTTHLRVNWTTFEALSKQFSNLSDQERLEKKRSKRQKMSEPKQKSSDIKGQNEMTFNDGPMVPAENDTPSYTSYTHDTDTHDTKTTPSPKQSKPKSVKAGSEEKKKSSGRKRKASEVPTEFIPQPGAALIHAYYCSLPDELRPAGKPSYSRYHDVAEAMADDGITPYDVVRFVTMTYPTYRVWAMNKGAKELMSFEHVNEYIKAYLMKGSTNGQNTPGVPKGASPAPNNGRIAGVLGAGQKKPSIPDGALRPVKIKDVS